MASHPPGQCCASNVKHEGIPQGQMIKIGTHNAYLASPPAGAPKHDDAGILYVPDVLGIWQNSKLLADDFANSGYTTLAIDLFRGDAIPSNMFPGVDLGAWLENGLNSKDGGHTAENIDPVVMAAIEYMKNTLGLKKIGAVGYCFGAKYVVRHYQSGIDVGFVAHPSFVEDSELAAITGPLSIAAAETDDIFPTELRHKSEEILKKNGNVYQINLYSGVNHGFAARLSTGERVERFARDQALSQALAFFNTWLF